MSGFANRGWLNEKGEELVVITAIDPRTSDLNQFERDCYDSGLVAGLKSERLRIIKLLEDSLFNASPEGLEIMYRGKIETADIENIIALIKGEN